METREQGLFVCLSVCLSVCLCSCRKWHKLQNLVGVYGPVRDIAFAPNPGRCVQSTSHTQHKQIMRTHTHRQTHMDTRTHVRTQTHTHHLMRFLLIPCSDSPAFLCGHARVCLLPHTFQVLPPVGSGSQGAVHSETDPTPRVSQGFAVKDWCIRSCPA